MGCDIHLYIEVKPTSRSNWRLAPDQLAPCIECNATGIRPESLECVNCKQPEESHLDSKCLYAPGTKYVNDPEDCYYCHEGAALAAHYGQRDYDLFGILSGVRGNSLPDWTQEDRGIPEDACPELQRLTQNDDLHSHGHYYLNELEQQPNGWEEFEDFTQCLKELKKLSKKNHDVRIVFCYDN